MSNKQIKYATLSKTANFLGVFAFKGNGNNYVGNSYCVIFGMNNNEFISAVEKTKANTQPKISTDTITNLINDIKKNGKNITYTKVCYDSLEGMIHFFKNEEDNVIISIDSKFYDLLKDQKIRDIIGTNNKSGIIFNLEDGRSIMIMPKKVNVIGDTGKYLCRILR